jgi:hypothetical protein
VSRLILVLVATLFSLILRCAAFAEEPATTGARGPNDLQSQWEQLVSKNMDLSDIERARFDPLYHEYRSAVAKIDDRFIDLLKTYTENYRSLDDQTALQLLKDYVAQRAERVQLDQAYMPRFEAIMSPKDVVRLFQIENKLRVKVTAYFAERVPLVEGDSDTATPAAAGTKTRSGSSEQTKQ